MEKWIIENTQEKFGPVHRLPAKQVFVVECSEITPSKRHKSGYRVTEATLISWENGMSTEHVNTTESLRDILKG
jgi:DNA ligase-1